MQSAHRGGEALLGHLVEVGDGDARRQPRVVRVLRRHVRGRLRSEVVERCGRHAVVHALDHLHRDDGGVDELGVEAVAELADPRSDLVKHHRLLAPIALHDLHRYGRKSGDRTRRWTFLAGSGVGRFRQDPLQYTRYVGF